jgi:hypothetical protein
MKEKRSLHLKVQELCDCYADGDPLKEMSTIKKEKDNDEAALKWLALAALHGVNNNAEEIAISRSAGDGVRVSATYRETQLPSPGSKVGKKIIQSLREITHIKEGKGKTPLALGIRQDSIELRVRFKKNKKGKDTITIRFPK